MKKLGIYCLLFIVFCFFVAPIQAAHILPYPSYMPGNKLYKVSRILDVVKNYWYFGSIAQIKYQLALSDKYLVEAKTLFEYKQYLLGVDALKRSTKEFQEMPIHVKQGQLEKKDMSLQISSISESAQAHKNVLLSMKEASPDVYHWTPEKDDPTNLNLHNEIDRGITTVMSVTDEVRK